MPYAGKPVDLPESNAIPIASVTIGELGYTDSGARYTDDIGSGDPYSIFIDYRILNKFEKDPHRYMMGVTSPGGNTDGTLVSFVQLASPTLLWICDWTACKGNVCPEIPDPAPNDPDWILLDEILEPTMLSVSADGETPLYRISGTYVYGHRKPNVKLNRNAYFTRPPWLQDVFNRTVPDSVFQKNLMDTNAAVPSPPGNARVVP